MAMNKDFGPFELKDKIGSGGMASVYLAVQKSLNRPVVLKILYPHLAEDEKLLQRFEREARAAAMMRHENIVQVIDCGRHGDVAYICMEFVEGMDLQKWLESNGTPPIEMALLMMRDICRGLEHAHGHRIIHRDIKPANIMLTPEGTIKIMDFGLARSGSETSTQMTMVGSVLGTPAYMSPEQATGEVVDERSDIFSVGVVAYELLGGRRPFSGDSYSTVLRAILTVDPPEVTEFNPLVPEEVAHIVRGMLQKDVAKRYATIAQARQELEVVIEQQGLLRGKDLLREYTLEPATVGERWRKKRMARHMDQGVYFEKMGLSKIDDALLEFRRVLHLDPENAEARKHLKKLEHEREQLLSSGTGLKAVKREAAAAVPAAPAAAAPAKPAAKEPEQAKPAAVPAAAAGASAPAKAKSSPPFALIAGVLVVAAIAVFAFLKMKGGGAAPETAIAPADSAAIATPAPIADAGAVAPAEPAADTAAVAATTCSLYVAVKPRADQVLINGKPMSGSETLFWTVLDPGRYKIEASAKGFVAASDRGRLAAGAVKRVALVLAAEPVAVETPAPATPPAPATTAPAVAEPANGILQQIAVSPKCDIYVDGQVRASNAALLEVRLAPGKHEIRFKHPDFAVARRGLNLKEGKLAAPLTVDLTRGEGGISVRAARAGLRIFVDDKSTGQTTPGVVRGLKPGRHKVDLREKDGTTIVASQSVVVEDSAGNQLVQF